MLSYLQELYATIGTGPFAWALFTSTFALVFIAELPDKTAFATLLLSTTHNPYAVFIGTAAAFFVQCCVAVAFGSVFSLLPEQPVQIAAGLLFIAFAVAMWRRRDDGDDKASGPDSGRFWTSAATSFMVIFIAEWGDLTQLATATLVAKYRAPLTIFTASVLALWAVSAIGIYIGFKLKRSINPARLQKIAAGAMALVGAYLLARLVVV